MRRILSFGVVIVSRRTEERSPKDAFSASGAYPADCFPCRRMEDPNLSMLDTPRIFRSRPLSEHDAPSARSRQVMSRPPVPYGSMDGPARRVWWRMARPTRDLPHRKDHHGRPHSPTCEPAKRGRERDRMRRRFLACIRKRAFRPSLLARPERGRGAGGPGLLARRPRGRTGGRAAGRARPQRACLQAAQDACRHGARAIGRPHGAHPAGGGRCFRRCCRSGPRPASSSSSWW